VFDRDRDRLDRYGSSNQSPAGMPAPNTLGGGVQTGVGTAVRAREGFLTMSFVWMFLALMASGVAAYFVINNARALEFVIRNSFILFIVQIGLAVGIQGLINRIGATVGLALLFAYAILTGAILSILALVYTEGSLLSAFLGASAIFAGAALYGTVTKRDLTSLGGILFMGMLGIVVVSLITFFLPGQNPMLNFILGVAGVVVFTGLTAYDVQRIYNGELSWIRNRDSASVIGALHLYIDFIGIFISMLRIFGSTRN